jgi:nitrogen PTS system EIIA component
MNIAKIFHEELCIINSSSNDKDSLLRLLANQGMKSPGLKGIDEEQLYSVFKGREEQGSTGFGQGIALPHARMEGVSDFTLFIVIAPSGVDWDASDGKKVKLFFVVIGPREKPKKYLKVLAVVSRANSSKKLHKDLLKVKDSSECARLFLKHTKGLGKKSAPSTSMTKMKLVMLILYDGDILNDILELFIQEGIEGANILDSWGMGHYISSIPLFMDFLGTMDEEKNFSKTIMAMVPEDKLDNIVNGVEGITGNLDKNNVAMILSVNIDLYKGTMKMI